MHYALFVDVTASTDWKRVLESTALDWTNALLFYTIQLDSELGQSDYEDELDRLRMDDDTGTDHPLTDINLLHLVEANWNLTQIDMIMLWCVLHKCTTDIITNHSTTFQNFT